VKLLILSDLHVEFEAFKVSKDLDYDMARRRHDNDLKRQVLEECAKPGASVARSSLASLRAGGPPEENGGCDVHATDDRATDAG